MSYGSGRNAGKPTALSGVWYLNPAVAFGVPCLVAGLAAYVTGDREYLEFWRTAKYFDGRALQLLIAIVTVFVIGCMLGGARRRYSGVHQTEDWTLAIRWPSVRLFFRISFALTMIAYAVWIAVAIKNGFGFGVIVDVIRGVTDPTDVRTQYLTTIPGVTTATQFGIAAVALAVPLAAANGWRTVRWQCVLMFLLAFFRAFINSERLAIIELVVPFIVSFIWLHPATTRGLQFLTRAAPPIAIGALYALFGVGEYFRSWTSFYAARHETSFWTFLSLRLMGYYTTALNNGALLWKVVRPLGLHLPFMSLDFLWHFPLAQGVLISLDSSMRPLIDTKPDVTYNNLLSVAANVEFNNPSGIFIPVVDCGVAGGLFYWLLSGLLCGYLYTEFKKRTLPGVFIYPVLYISLIESSRVLYWSDGRFLPGVFFVLIGVLFVFRKSPKVVFSYPVLEKATPFS